MHWIINDNIEFRPEMKKLISVSNPEINVTLTAPASRCLLLLLEASPEIVLQQDFFKKVWEEEGMLVPTNTLYQNISIVRRGLRAVGETDSRLIATIPRKGFQIDDSVKIKKKDKASVPLPAGIDIADAENEDPFTPHDTPVDQPTWSVLNVHANENEPVLPAVSGRHKIPESKPARSTGWRLSTAIIFAAFATGLLIIASSLPFGKTPLFFDNYNFVENDNGCQIYIKDDTHDSKDYYQKYKNMIKNTGLNCKIYPWVYFPVSATSPTLTALACKNDFKNSVSPGCISLYFRSVQGE